MFDLYDFGATVPVVTAGLASIQCRDWSRTLLAFLHLHPSVAYSSSSVSSCPEESGPCHWVDFPRWV